MKAISINVYRTNGSDCTNNGISKFWDTLLLECDEGYINLDENNLPENLVKLSSITFGGKTHYYLEPVKPAEGVGYMFGGNIAYTSDSRFPFEYPLNIHDRDESQEMYDWLSR